MGRKDNAYRIVSSFQNISAPTVIQDMANNKKDKKSLISEMFFWCSVIEYL